MDEEDKIYDSIATHWYAITQLNEIKERVEDHIDNKLDFVVKTRHISKITDFHIFKDQDQLPISKYTMNVLLDTAIELEKARIYKLIDMLIERREKEMNCDDISRGRRGDKTPRTRSNKNARK